MICPNCGKSLWFLRDFCVFCRSKLLTPPRPKSVTVISWIAIVMGVGQGFVLYVGSRAVPSLFAEHRLSMTGAFMAAGLLSVSGIVMLRGMNWGRWLLVIAQLYIPVSQIVFAKRVPNLTGVLFFGIFTYFLFRPAANAFFCGRASVVRTLAEGLAECNECRHPFPVTEMVRHGATYVCPACKPRFMQKLAEGAEKTAP